MVNIIKSRLSDLKNEIWKIYEAEKRTEQPEKVVGIIEDSLDFYNQKQKGQRLNILTPDQIISWL